MSAQPPDERITCRPLLLFAFVAFATAFGLASRLFASGAVFVGSGGDAVSLVLPHLDFIASALREGRIPLWNPHIFTGVPELAAAQWGVLYPFETLLLPVLGSKAYLAVTLPFHLGLTAVTGYLLTAAWLRSAGYPPKPMAAAVGGAGIALSGFMTGRIYAGHLGIVQAMPWCVLLGFAGIECLRGRQSFGALLALSLATIILAGGVAILPFAMLAASAVWALSAERWSGRLVARIAMTVLWIFIGMAMAGIQLLPTIELALQSARNRVDLGFAAAQWVLKPDDLVGLLIPPSGSESAPWETRPYVGPVIALLALIPIFFRTTRTLALWSWLTAVFFVMLAGPVGAAIQSSVPGLGLLRVPARALLGMDILLCLLAALAVVMLSQRQHGRAISSVALCATAAFGIFAASPAFKVRSWQDESMVDAAGELFSRLKPHFRAISVLRPAWNSGMSRGWLHLGGYEPFAPYRTALMTKALATGDPLGPWVSMYAIYPAVEEPRPDPSWDAFSVKLILAREGFSPPAPIKVLHAEGGYALWDNPLARPRARFTSCAEAVQGPEEALLRLASSPTTEFIEVQDVGPCVQALSSVRIVRDEPENIEIEVEASAAGWLVVSDLAYPGWEADVDGSSAEVVPANAAGRAVRLPEGRHVVTMRFEPLSFRFGALLSAFGFLSIAAIFVCLKRHRFPRPTVCAIRQHV